MIHKRSIVVCEINELNRNEQTLIKVRVKYSLKGVKFIELRYKQLT